MMELLAPAGGYEALTAAVQSGADVVYMGFVAFNARRSARNFTDEEFASAVAYCHLRGVRVFLTLNTLVTDRELPGAAEVLRKASAMGVDAVLVQDWGLLTLAKEIVPDLPIHASTQMSLFTLGGAVEAAALGCRCGSCFHVIWNQEREAADLDQKMSEDTSASVKVAVEGLKRLIEADRKAGR